MTCSKRSLSMMVLMMFVSSQVVYAEPAPDTLPAGYTPVAGSTSYTVNGNTGTLVSNGPATVGHWDSFSIGSQSTFNAQIEGAHLSKVVGQNPSEIFGALNVQGGQFFLVNPSGILFGPSSQVNAPGLVASTLDILENDFLAGRYDFNALAGSGGSLANQGHIQIEKGGYVALVGRSVANSGVISAEGAGVVMAAGDGVTLSLDEAGLVSAMVTTPVQADVYDLEGHKIADTLTNSGTIQADGGYAVLTARSAEDVFDNVINHSGAISANSIENKNGVITLTGGSDKGIVRVSGDMQASGGEIQITGNKVGVFGSADVDVSSNAGDGGKIILFAEDIALAYGSFRADSYVAGGDGGFIETSGVNYIDTYGIRVSASAVEGEAGLWLLDPRDVTITTSATSGGAFGLGVFSPTADNAILDVNTVNTALNAGTSVTVNTGGTGTQAGDITVAAPITKSAANSATLTLTAAGSIFINEAISSTVGPLGMTMTAGNNITIGDSSGDTLNAGSGTVSLTATSGSINGSSLASPHITAGSVSLSSGVGIGTSTALKIDAPLLSSATVSGAGLINISDASGGLVVNSATTSNGNITLNAVSGNLTVVNASAPGGASNVNLSTTTSGNVFLGSITAQNQVTVNSAGSIADNTNDSLSDVSVATSVNLTAVSGIGDGATGSLDLTTPNITATVSGSGGVVLDLMGAGVKTLSSITTQNGDIDVTSTDSMIVGQVAAGTGGTARDVYLTANAGFIKDNVGANDSIVDAIGDLVWVSSVSGIGEANTSGSFDINAKTVYADTTTGGIFVNLINSAEPSHGLAANHSLDAYAVTSGAADIVFTGTTGSGDRDIFGAETFNGHVNISSADGDLYADNIFTDIGLTVGTNDITIQASGASGGDLYIGYLQTDDIISLTATNGSILDSDFDFQNLAAGGSVNMTAGGDVGTASNPIEHPSSITPTTTGVSGTVYLTPCDSFFCGSTTGDPFLDAISAAYTSLYTEGFEDVDTTSGSSDEMMADAEQDSSEEGSSDSDEEDDDEEGEDKESTDGAGQSQTEQQKDVENDTPAADNVTVNEQTFNPC